MEFLKSTGANFAYILAITQQCRSCRGRSEACDFALPFWGGIERRYIVVRPDQEIVATAETSTEIRRKMNMDINNGCIGYDLLESIQIYTYIYIYIYMYVSEVPHQFTIQY